MRMGRQGTTRLADLGRLAPSVHGIGNAGSVSPVTGCSSVGARQGREDRAGRDGVHPDCGRPLHGQAPNLAREREPWPARTPPHRPSPRGRGRAVLVTGQALLDEGRVGHGHRRRGVRRRSLRRLRAATLHEPVAQPLEQPDRAEVVDAATVDDAPRCCRRCPPRRPTRRRATAPASTPEHAASRPSAVPRSAMTSASRTSTPITRWPAPRFAPGSHHRSPRRDPVTATTPMCVLPFARTGKAGADATLTSPGGEAAEGGDLLEGDAHMLDLLIRGGDVVDGTGAPRRARRRRRPGRAHRRDRRRRRARDAAPSTPTASSSRPGFVDIHTHYDAQAFWDPALTPVAAPRRHDGGRRQLRVHDRAARADAETDYLTRMLARVEGMPLESLAAGVP